MHFLKQSTAVEISVGPFLDSTDGTTPETALTISQADVRLKKEGGAWAQKNDSSSATHEENGYYEVALNTTDTNTLGRLRLAVNESGALPLYEDFTVLSAQVYDSLIGGTDLLDVSVTQLAGTAISQAAGLINANVTQVSGDATAADNLETALDDTAGAVPWLGILDQGTAQSATSTTLVLRAAAAFADDVLNGAILMVFGSTQGYWQARQITDYVASTDTATVDAWAVTPSGTITYKVLAAQTGLASAAAVDTIDNFLDTEMAAVLAAVDTEVAAIKAVTDALPNAGALTTIQADLDNIQTRLPTALVNGRMDSNMSAISDDAAAADALELAFDDSPGPVPELGILDRGTAQSVTSTTIVLRSAAAFANDEIIGASVHIYDASTGKGQTREIKDYVSSTDTATVDAWTTTPTGTIKYEIFAGPPAPTTPPGVNVTHVIGDPVMASSSKTTNWGGTP